jgi:hypothetical protein
VGWAGDLFASLELVITVDWSVMREVLFFGQQQPSRI